MMVHFDKICVCQGTDIFDLVSFATRLRNGLQRNLECHKIRAELQRVKSGHGRKGLMLFAVRQVSHRYAWSVLLVLLAVLFLVGPCAMGSESARTAIFEPELQSIKEIEALHDQQEKLRHWTWVADEDRNDTLRTIVASNAASVSGQSPEFSLLVLNQQETTIVLESEAEYYRDVGAYIMSDVLSRRSAEISKAMSNVIVATTHFGDAQIDSDVLAASAAVLDKNAWRLISEMEDVAWGVRWPKESALEVSEEDMKKFLLGQVHRLLNAAEAADEARYHKERIMPLHAITSIRNSAHMIVAISLEQPSGDRVHIGTGFIYNGHVITAAHVLTEDKFWPEGFGPDLACDLSSLRVLHVSENGDRFDTDALVPIRLDAVKIWPELDVAALRIGEADSPRGEAALLAAESVPVSFEATEDDSRIGIVYGLTSVEPGSIKPTPMWIPPGRIVFPSEIFKPSHARGMDGGVHYFRAVRAEIFGTSALNCSDKQLADVALRVWNRYSVCRINEIQCRLAGDYGRSRGKLSAIAGRALDSVPCFGTDLVTEPAASGSPIFRLAGETQVLVGIHLGVAGPTGGVPTRTSLSNYGRVAPFILAKEKIDAWIIEGE